MTTSQRPPRTDVLLTRDRRHAMLRSVRAASDALVTTGPGVPGDGAPARALAAARAAVEDDDGTGGRAAAAVRTAWAHLSAGQVEDAFLALESASILLEEH